MSDRECGKTLWSIEVTIENLKEVERLIQSWLISINYEEKEIQDTIEAAIDFERAIKALKKQVPKQPHYEGDEYPPDDTFVWDEWLCPNCSSRYEVDYDDYNYCPNCGQRIDWSDKK